MLPTHILSGYFWPLANNPFELQLGTRGRAGGVAAGERAEAGWSSAGTGQGWERLLGPTLRCGLGASAPGAAGTTEGPSSPVLRRG